MSGPKSSRYRVTAEMLRQLEEARRLEAERLRREEEARLERIRNSDNALDILFNKIKFDSPPHMHESEEMSQTDNISNIVDILTKCEKDDRISVDLRKKVAESKVFFTNISDETYRKNYLAITINPLLKRYREYINFYEDTADLRAEYKVWCTIAGETVKEFHLSTNTLTEIQQEIERLKTSIIETDEKAYIETCLNDIMRDMGYNVVGYRDVSKKNGRHFHNQLYAYADGTAINVTTDDKGQIAMELCGVDNIDRVPEHDEAEQLTRYMESFCDDFSKIERRLMVKGIVVENRFNKLPPKAEYAQIINVSEFNMSEEIEKFYHEKNVIQTPQRIAKEF